MTRDPVLDREQLKDEVNPVLQVLREVRDNSRKAAQFAQAAGNVPAALAEARKLSADVTMLHEHTHAIQSAAKQAQEASEGVQRATSWLLRIRGTVTIGKLSAAFLGLLAAFCGGFVIGHWFVEPALWPLGLSTEGACIRAGGKWVTLTSGNMACLFVGQ